MCYPSTFRQDFRRHQVRNFLFLFHPIFTTLNDKNVQLTPKPTPQENPHSLTASTYPSPPNSSSASVPRS